MKTGRNIRSIRKQRGLTLDELSILCGVNRDDLGLYERGQMTPRPGTVKKIADALNVPLAAIREGIGWTAPEPAEQWEASGDSTPLHDGVLEAVWESCGADFALAEDDVRALMEAVKASIPALVEHMKDTRSEAEINRALLSELALQPDADEADLVRQYELTDEQWAQIAPLLPVEKSGRGRAFKSNRLMVDGIIHHIKSGAAWKDLPERYGRYKCVSDRLHLWERTGVWRPVVDKLAELGVIEADSSPYSESP